MKIAMAIVVTFIALILFLYLAGFKIFVIKPIGAVPDGVVLVVRGAPALRFVDSPDSLCERVTGQVTLMCRAMSISTLKEATIIVRLPYSRFFDVLAGTPETDR